MPMKRIVTYVAETRSPLHGCRTLFGMDLLLRGESPLLWMVRRGQGGDVYRVLSVMDVRDAEYEEALALDPELLAGGVTVRSA
jgi:hypothetical protein